MNHLLMIRIFSLLLNLSVTQSQTLHWPVSRRLCRRVHFQWFDFDTLLLSLPFQENRLCLTIEIIGINFSFNGWNL